MAKVYNMESPRSGREVANQFVIEAGREVVFQSYRSVCAIYNRDTKTLTLGEDWNRSMTTRKYFWQFVRNYLPYYWDIDLKELRSRIASGEVKVLNNREIEAAA
jgi:hypothetical protein